jgi:hypothetical protein
MRVCGRIVFIVKGVRRTVWVHDDAYPSGGLGDRIARFISDRTAEEMDEMSRKIEQVSLQGRVVFRIAEVSS